MPQRRAIPSYAVCTYWLVRFTIALRWLGYARAVAMVKRAAADAGEGSIDPTVANAIGQRVASVAALMPGRVRCLEQSLTLFVLLRRSGYAASLRIGVQPNRFRAHAWVEHNGAPVMEDDRMDGYVPFAPIAS